MKTQIALLATNISLAVSAAIFKSFGLPNGGVWKDADGVRINAHGGGLLKDGDTKSSDEKLRAASGRSAEQAEVPGNERGADFASG